MGKTERYLRYMSRNILLCDINSLQSTFLSYNLKRFGYIYKSDIILKINKYKNYKIMILECVRI